MRTESAKVLKRTESADWRTKFLKSADWCNPDSDSAHYEWPLRQHVAAGPELTI